MLDFITFGFRLVFGYITGSWQSALTAVATVIRDMFRTQYGYWHTVSGKVISAWTALARNFLIFREAMLQYIAAQYRLDAKVQKAQIPWLANWITWLGGKIRDEFIKRDKAIYAKMQSDYNANHRYTSSVLRWIIVHVFLFLLGRLLKVLGWILSRGDVMWGYFADVIKFGEFLIWGIVAAIEKHSWDIGKRLGKFFLSLLVHNIVRFLTLIESVISEVL